MSNNLVLGDSDIRPVLRSRLRLKHANDTDTVVIEELGLCRGQVRVDVSVVNGLLHGYEIKSDRIGIASDALPLRQNFMGRC